MRIQARTRTSRDRGEISMTCQGVGCEVESLCRPGECDCCAVQLGFGHRLLVEVAFAQDKEVSGRIVIGGGVADQFGRAQLEDVPVQVDADVVGDVDSAVLVLVVALVLAKAAGDDAVVVEGDAGVVDRHAGNRVVSSAGARRGRPPGFPAQQARWDDNRCGHRLLGRDVTGFVVGSRN